MVNRTNALSVPLKIHEDLSAFKLFMLNCGLLGAMSNTPAALFLLPNNDNTGKGSFTENFVCCQLQSLRNIPMYYYSKDNSQLELDFVIQLDAAVIPIELKAEENLQSKSLKTTLASNPGMRGVRFSMSDYREQDRLTNVPLYGARAYLERKLS